MSDEDRINELGQAIGREVAGWTRRQMPPRRPIVGRYTLVDPLDPSRHGDDLFAAYSEDATGAMWTYMAYGPFEDREQFDEWLRLCAAGDDPLFHSIVDAATGRALGLASYLRIDPGGGVIEVGHISYSPALQRTRTATEAMYLMMRRVFDELGYRRYEWKADALNRASASAAARLGFTYEGTFRQATMYKGRNRDTAWYSMIDSEWPARRQALEAWLDPGSFDEDGRQRSPLGR
ncbi:MAG TPA: GNAT family protein [Acidimicrobiia bacterium]|jgi:RimJ/RimL family protein N-acetyltransferase